MIIELNHRKEDLPFDELTVQELLQYKNFTFKMLIIRINDSLVPREEYSTTVIYPGDRVIVLHLISGG